MMTLPVPVETPDAVPPPVAPPPALPAPRLDPATAFATPSHVLAWLLRQEEAGKRSVGRSGDAEQCPLARFARTELGLRHPEVANLVYESWDHPPIQGLHLRHIRDDEYDACTSLRLPEWCRAFVLRVDAQKVRLISPQRALRILGEVMTNEDAQSCPT